MITENHSKRFRLISLKIYPECAQSIRKILQPGLYPFEKAMNYGNSDVAEDIADKMYGKKVSIQVIVGKNGSGKTSLLDMIYRLINNYCFFLMRRLKHTQSSGRLSFVHGVYAKLKYSMDGEIWNLESRGEELALYNSEIGYRVGNDVVQEWHQYEDVNKANVEKAREVMTHFFYTLVTNYSFNSFLSSDYASEKTSEFHGSSWVDNLFHKNDGYRTPIVLNPYRDKGQLNVQQETDFAVSRTIAILIQFQNGNTPSQFIDGYELDRVDYRFDASSFWKKFTRYMSSAERNARAIAGLKSQESYRKKFEAAVMAKFKRAFDDPNTYANQILSVLKIVPEFNNQVQFASCCYLVYKVFSILGNYPVYEDYSFLGDLSFCFKKMSQSETERKTEILILNSAIEELTKKDKSHITYKLRLALQFLRSPFVNSFSNTSSAHFEIRDYVSLSECKNVERIMEALPITLFKPTITLRRVLGEGQQGELVPFTSLSSGEKLFTYTLGTIVYHVLNLKSVDSHRIHYRNFNIVMDELELCFHPEMQRQFVNKLVSTIQRLRLNLHCHFNLLLVTHSPFILSDIPGHNILYLEDGKNVSNFISVNPFGTNINNVLCQNFFLSKTGFVGDIAQKMILSISDALRGSSSNTYNGWSIELAEYFIENIVGDDVIKMLLRDLLEEKKKDNQDSNATDIHR